MLAQAQDQAQQLLAITAKEHNERLRAEREAQTELERAEVVAGPHTSPLSQLNLSDCVSVTTQLIPLIHSEVLK